MFIGIALSVTARLLGGGFSPAVLFALNEPGVWLDPSDLTTLFQDTAGTIPVTAAGQSVALALDKSKGLVLGSELFSRTLDFSNAVWLKTASVTSSGVQTFTTNAQGGVYSTIAGVSASARYRVRVTGTTTTQLAIRNDTDVAGQAIVFAGSFDVTLNSQIFSGSSGLFFQLGAAGTATITFVSIREIPGNHATQATPGSRPTYQVDGTGRGYLLFDGVDDFLQTPSINFSATNKMTVFAGMRKLSDAAQAELLGLTAAPPTGSGTFWLQTPNAAAATNYVWNSRGTATSATSATPFAAPDTAVITGIGDISGDSGIIRRNGVQISASAADQGTGNYANDIVYIGRRGGTTLPFNGRLYSLIVRGAETTAADITASETWVNSKTGAY